MFNRLSSSDNNLFQCYLFLEYNKDEKLSTVYPVSFAEKREMLDEVSKFAHPFEYSALFCRYGSQFYVFTLTDMNSNLTFGFCVFLPTENSVHCFLTANPFFSLFELILKFVVTSLNEEEKMRVIRELYVFKPSTPHTFYTVYSALNPTERVLKIVTPDPYQTPIGDNLNNLLEVQKILSVDNIVNLFMAALFERQIIIKSKKLTSISCLAHCITCIIWPLTWEHVFIPLLPEHLLDYIEAPMPFIIGVASSLLHKNPVSNASAITVDLDNGSVMYPAAQFKKDCDLFYREDIRKACVALERRAGPREMSEFFLNIISLIINHYQLCFHFKNDQVMFNREKFINMYSTCVSPDVQLLKCLISTQSFTQFIQRKITNFTSGRHSLFDRLCDDMAAAYPKQLSNFSSLLNQANLTPSKPARVSKKDSINSVDEEIGQETAPISHMPPKPKLPAPVSLPQRTSSVRTTERKFNQNVPVSPVLSEEKNKGVSNESMFAGIHNFQFRRHVERTPPVHKEERPFTPSNVGESIKMLEHQLAYEGSNKKQAKKKTNQTVTDYPCAPK